jgi:hypothetical protein
MASDYEDDEDATRRQALDDLHRVDGFTSATRGRVRAFSAAVAEFRELGMRLAAVADQLDQRLIEQGEMVRRLIRALEEGDL